MAAGAGAPRPGPWHTVVLSLPVPVQGCMGVHGVIGSLFQDLAPGSWFAMLPFGAHSSQCSRTCLCLAFVSSPRGEHTNGLVAPVILGIGLPV